MTPPTSSSSPQMRRNIVPIRPRNLLHLISLERSPTLRSRNSLNVFRDRALTRLHRVQAWWSGRLTRWWDLKLLRRGHLNVVARLWSWNRGEFREVAKNWFGKERADSLEEPGSPATKPQDRAYIAVLRLVRSPGSLAHKTEALV